MSSASITTKLLFGPVAAASAASGSGTSDSNIFAAAGP